MSYNEIENILSHLLTKEHEVLDKPTNKEWESLSNKFNCSFSDEFKWFIELMASWSFPGDIYNVSTKRNNGNDMIEEVYNHEMQHGNWKEDMIPFYGIGNGDYFCISSLDAKVYYYYEDKDKFEEYCVDFEQWIKELPDFLEGNL